MCVKLIHLWWSMYACMRIEWMLAAHEQHTKRTLAQPNYLKVTLGTNSNWIEATILYFSIFRYVFFLFKNFPGIISALFHIAVAFFSFPYRGLDKIWLRWLNFTVFFLFANSIRFIAPKCSLLLLSQRF